MILDHLLFLREVILQILFLFFQVQSIGIGLTDPEASLHVSGNAGFLVEGDFGSGETISASGEGTRLFFFPDKAAFRAGGVTGTQWDDSSVGDYSIAMEVIIRPQEIIFIGGGLANDASGDYSAIPGGLGNEASGDYSFVAGITLRLYMMVRLFGQTLHLLLIRFHLLLIISF